MCLDASGSKSDKISSFTGVRSLVIQCKFYDQPVSISHLNNVNIPSLIHQYKANGYLLICKDRVAASTSNMFEGLMKSCRFNYQYKIWTGADFKDFLYPMVDLHQQFFPKYHYEMLKLRKDIETL